VNFTNDLRRNVWIYFLKYKSDVFDVSKKWLAQVENETCQKLKCLKPDNGANTAMADSKSFARVGEFIE